MGVAKCLVIVGGSKGGVGKSLMAMCLVDYLACKGRAQVLVIDGDDSNPDVAKCHGALKPAPIRLNLDIRDGWMDLADQCSGSPDAHVVVNTGARSLDALIRYSGPVLGGIERGLKRHIATIWVINNQRDSVELLRSYMDGMVHDVAGRLHVACNQGEQEGRSFSFYEGTNTAKAVARSGGQVITIPTLANRAVTLLYTERKAIRDIAEGESVAFGTRLEAARWRGEVWSELGRLRLMDGFGDA